jgi:integrase
MDQKFYVSDERVAELKPIPGKKYEKRDAQWPGLLVRIEASGRKSYYYRYSINRRVRWFRIGPSEMGAAAAKKRVRQLIGVVANGGDPQAERRAQRGGVTFGQLADRYIEHAEKTRKSWKQSKYLIDAFVRPKWDKLAVAGLTRADVRQLFKSIAAPKTANQVKAAISTAFRFGMDEEIVTVNPCRNIKRNETRARDRILSDSEVGQLWAACDKIHPVKAAALRVTLLLGARPGEVCHMRREHIRDNWWEQPGLPITKEGSGKTFLIWPGTKNHCNHRVWLPARVRELIGLDAGHPASGFVFANERGNAYGQLNAEMREISRMCGFDPPVTAHDLRRSFSSTVTERGHRIEAMERLINHRKKSEYDRARYARQNQAIWEDVVAALLELAEGKREDNVVGFHR